MESPDANGPTGFSLKERKEEFVKNLQGSTMLEIAALSALMPIFVILRQVFDLLLLALKENYVKSGSHQQEQSSKGRNGKDFVIELAMDVIFVGVPTLTSLTVLADWVCVVLTVSVFLTLTGIAGLLRLNQKACLDLYPKQSDHDANLRQTFLSSFRFTMMLVTCVTILAVDFNVFPRRYAKTETYGTGLMDVGVGSFVVANGLVSRQARGLPPSKNGGVLRNTSPLLILGFCRLILTKGVDYQEHVAEYGVHWNFFFTLAAVALLTSLIHIPSSRCGTFGMVMLGVYQTILSSGLNEYLLSPARGPGLISLNKEGTCSILGYWSIYLFSVQMGRYFLAIPKRGKGTALWYIAGDIWLLTAIFWFLTILADEYIERISRRTCNLAYVIFVFAMNLEIIAIFLTAELILPFKQILLLQIFDHNLLATFLLGNVLTGLVNISMDTISASSAVALITLFGYLATLIGGMAVVELSGLRLKFW